METVTIFGWMKMSSLRTCWNSEPFQNSKCKWKVTIYWRTRLKTSIKATWWWILNRRKRNKLKLEKKSWSWVQPRSNKIRRRKRDSRKRNNWQRGTRPERSEGEKSSASMLSWAPWGWRRKWFMSQKTRMAAREYFSWKRSRSSLWTRMSHL